MLPSIFGESLFDDWMDSFDKEFEREFQKELAPAKRQLYGKHAKNLMKTDVKDMDDHYEVDIDLPGFKKDEVNAELKDGYITISAAKSLDKDEKDKKTGKYIRQERYVGSNQRTFYVGDVKPEEVKCKYDAGVLMIEFPKKDARKVEGPHTIAIE